MTDPGKKMKTQKQKFQEKNREFFKKQFLKIHEHAILVAVFLGIFLVPAFITSIFPGNTSFSNVFVGNIKVGNMKKTEIQKILKNKIQKYEKKPLKIIYRGKGVLLSTEEMGIQWDPEETIKKIHFRNQGNANIFAMAAGIFEEKKINMELKIDSIKITEIVKKNFEFQDVKNARITWKEKQIIIEKEIKGEDFDRKKFEKNLKENMQNFSSQPVILVERKFTPDISVEALEKNFETIKTQINKPIKIQTGGVGGKEKNIFLRDYLNEIRYKKTQNILFASTKIPKIEERIIMEINPEIVKKILQDEFSKEFEYAPSSIKILMNENGKVVFEGRGEPGSEIEYEEAVRLVNKAANENIGKIELPIRRIPNEVFISENLQALGVKELIADGHTTYYGSPANRMHNIQNGTEKFNGLMIKPGETFSFNEHLGKVDGSTGYRKELVIKPEGTIPEYGGGLCQVSTTMYRAALNAGFPIIERKPHSYVVMYYAQIGGHGIDATIYPGASDLKFTNDTRGDILMQSYTEGAEVHFKFYGTSDGRKIALEGPIITNYRSPGETEIIKTAQLPIGTKKQVEKPHNGFDTLWYRSIIQPNGEIKKEEITSKYRAIPARILVGAESTEIIERTETGEQYFRD